MRLQRRLNPQGLRLHRCRQDSCDLPTLGRFNVADPAINGVVATDIHLADWLAEVAQ